MPAMKGADPELFDARQQCTNDVVRSVAAAHPGVRVVDLAEWTCPQWPSCRDEADGVLLRSDGVHFNDEGATVVASWMVPQLIDAAGS